jgi:predicted RNA-binding Zn ribbon-like protein
MFIADALGLDFLNSIAAPAGAEIEWLANGEDLLAWLGQAKLVPADIATSMRVCAFPGELDAVAAQARALREWFRAFVLAHKGKPLTSDVVKELAALNEVLQRDDIFGTIATPSKGAQDHLPDQSPVSGLAWRVHRRWRGPASLLQPVAQAMAEFVCSADFSQVKECEGPTCTLLFLDTTHGGARRWCSMAICGNRAKQAAHRNRTKRAET